VCELRAFARSSRAVESLEKRLLFAARIEGSAAVYATIQDAVNAAPVGATINVDAGVYSELVNVYKTLTIRGPRAGIDGRSNLRNDRAGEAIVNGVLGAVTGLRTSAFHLNADNIVLDGFTVEGQNATNSYNAAIHFAAGRNGIRVLNNVVQHNATGINLVNSSNSNPAVIRGNLFRENNQVGPHTGRAIYSDGSISGGTLNNVIIDNNVFFKNHGYDPNFAVQPAVGLEAQSTSSVQKNIQITSNVFDYNGKGILAYNASDVTIANNVFTHNRDTTSANLRFEGGMSDVVVRDNLFYANGARAIRIDQKVIKSANQNFSITNNNFFHNGRDSGGQRTAIMVDSGTFTGTLDGTGNFFGAASGPCVNFVGGSGTGDTIWTGGNSINYAGWKTAPIETGSTLQIPYFRNPLDVTAPVMFADYDHGGQSVAFSDTTTNNQGNVLHRYQAVDLQVTSDPGFGISAGYQLAWVKAGEWVEYTVNVPTAGAYDMQIRLSNANSAALPGRFRLEVDGVPVTGSITPTTTGGYANFATQTINNVVLPAGAHVLRWVFESNGSTGYVSNFVWFRFVPPTVTPPPPDAPSDLVAAAASHASVNLTWADNADNESGYIVERSLDGVDWIEVGTADSNATSYVDSSGVAPSTTYLYRVRATNAGGDSDYSNVDDATTPTMPTIPAAPSNLIATAASASQINLLWNDNADNETGFVIERSPNGVDGWTQVGTTGANVDSFSDTTGLSPSTTYFYRVRATNAAGASDNSNVDDATTAAAPLNETIIPAGSVWKYLDNGSNQGTAWRALGFNDSAWKSGAAELGYGDGDEATVVSYGSSSTGKFITTYFRKTFDITDASLVSALTLRLLRDDGAVLYLNGVEIFRTNMPSGTIGYTTRASTFIGGADEMAWLTTSVNPALLVSGQNILAVEIHQDSSSSSDISFNAELIAMLAGSPTAPAAPSNLAATAVSPTKINLTWADNSANESGFVVERSLNGVDGWIEIVTTAANAMGYTDATNVNPSTQYFYRVRAINGVGPSANSNVDDAITPATQTNFTFISAGSVWKYLDNGSNQGTAWRNPAFNDSGWKSGAGELGYGDGDETTVVSYGSSSTKKFITTYFRKTFDVADPAAVGELTMRLLRDDGVVIYLNGVEAYRNNMPTGTIGYTTRASTFIGGADETTWLTALLNPALLVAGDNVIAVEIHQDSPSSSDISFDLELTAKAQTSAAARAVQPSTKTSSSTFSASVIEEIEELA
jgi:hypothetical protein